MKKFLKIVLFTILTLCFINVSNTKINFLSKGDNVSIEKVKSPRKNAYINEDKIKHLTDLSFTEWHQVNDLSTSGSSGIFYYTSNTFQTKVCDIINYNDNSQIREVYTNSDNQKSLFSMIMNLNELSFYQFYACKKGSNTRERIPFYEKNILKFYDMSTFTTDINNSTHETYFIDILKSKFNLYVEDAAYLQINDNITENREEIEKNFKHISIKGLNGTFNLNEKIDITPIISNDNITDLEISLVYNDLPTIIYDLFTVNYPVLSDSSKKYTLSGNVQKQWGNLTRTIKFTINNRDLDSSNLKIDLFTCKHTINALRGKSFILNTNINLPEVIKGSTNYYIEIRPAFAYTNTIQPGFYVSYVYTQNKVLNEYMDFYSTNYYKYVMQINKAINTSGDLGISLYDNDNSPKASGTPFYNFTKNSYIEDYHIPPRLITFTNQFNTNNLITMKLNSQGEGSSFIFDAYDWLLSNGELYQINDYETAYSIGYSEGMHFSTSSTNWIKSVFNAVDSILQVEILPNFKLWYIIAIPLLFGCVLFVFKILR